jgi:hypothetical protein
MKISVSQDAKPWSLVDIYDSEDHSASIFRTEDEDTYFYVLYNVYGLIFHACV